ncbi:hypothetical protein F5Y18DRAFT_116405 [Xylariaceae sp. FL1019]|nr:hypothetical protein F5Y18DRAFT_116405 [Xylariaceae sp. FL1019]
MSFGFGVGDFIAGANLAHKLIRVMTETRGASIEYQEALAELCGIQQVFIQITQLSRNDILPKSTLNALAQIIMPSMAIIADFLDRTKHYQAKLSRKAGGLESSWCKVGWALFRRDELKMLRDTLHARLSAINTLLAAANHLPSKDFPALPDTIARFEETEDSHGDGFSETAETTEYSDESIRKDVQTLKSSLVAFRDSEQRESQEKDEVALQIEATVLETDIGARVVSVPVGNNISMAPAAIDAPESHSIAHTHSMASQTLTTQASTQEDIGRPPKHTQSSSRTELRSPRRTMPDTADIQVKPKMAVTKVTDTTLSKSQDLESYLHNLLQTAITIQADAEAKAKAAQRAAEEAEWRQRIEESVRLKTELDIRERIEFERKEFENIRAMEEERKASDQATKKRLLEEAKKALENEEKAPIRFKDAVGRKFTFPFHIIRTWAGMEEVIKQAFFHVDIVGPHVQQGHYDLVGPNGEIILPQIWEKVIEPDWAISMHMWPMDRAGVPVTPPRPMGGRPVGGAPLPPRPGTIPGRPALHPGLLRVSKPAKKKNTVGAFLGRKLQSLRRRKSTSSMSSSSSDSSYS